MNLRERILLVQALRRAVFFEDQNTLKQRYSRLLTLFFNPKGTSQSDDAPAIQKLVTEVLKLPKSSYNESEVGRKIRTVYASMLPWLTDAEPDGIENDAVETSADKHVEECEICDDSIGFESFAWARCSQGHEFGEFTWGTCSYFLLANSGTCSSLLAHIPSHSSARHLQVMWNLWQALFE